MSHIKKPCRYILNKESCPFGRRCKFLHQIEKDLSLEKLSVSDRVGTPESGTQAAGDTRKNSKHSPSHHDVQLAKSCGGRNDADDVGSEDQVTVRVPAKSATVKEGRDSSSDEGRKHIRDKVCHFYLQHGNCKFGEKCRFRHSERLQMKEQAAIVGDQGKLSRQNKKTQQAIEPDQHHPPPLTLASFIGSRPHVQRPRRVNQSNSASCLRDVELEQFHARFPGEKCSLLTKSQEEIAYLVRFQPADQDWNGPAVLLLEVKFPSNYPEDYCQVKLSLHQELAHDVVEIGNEAIKQYWKSSMLGQLMFRPFLHWWDKNLVDILQTPFSETNETTERNHSSTDNDSDVVCEEDIQESVQPLIKSKRGTEIRFIGLDVGQSLGTAFWTSVKIVISCERCKNPQEIEVKEERLYSVVCGRCSNSMCVLYHLALIHSASSTLGYLELTRCIPVDVIFQFSSLTITCLNCSSEITSQGFSIGQPKDVYCHRCHNKITLNATGVKFLQHQQAEGASRDKAEEVTVHLFKKKRDDTLKDGEPLPEYGTCQHYKKSHRWLRFPCCGRAFPCDICHDSAQDHPMEHATRMICGYCSKEQGYSGKGNCVRCASDLISSKHSSHWEGGQGCRNRTKMSRLDKQKYKSSDVKTVCRKSERVGKK